MKMTSRKRGEVKILQKDVTIPKFVWK